MAERMEDVAPELARALQAVYRVSRAARTRAQQRAANTITDRWTALALRAGWSRMQIADAVGARPDAITDRARRRREGESIIPNLLGVLAVPRAPLPHSIRARTQRQRLIGSAEVAQLVGCQPRSVKHWAQSRGVSNEWTPGGAKRLYDRFAVLAAADKRPTQRHNGWQRRKNVAIPPQMRGEIDAPTTRPLTSA